MAKSKQYWAERSERRLLDALDESGALERELKLSYREAAEAINDEVAKLYGRYAGENALSYTRAMAYIQGPAYRKWRMSLQEYVDLVEATGSDRLKLELETLAMRSRITRLDALMTQVKLKLVELADYENRGLAGQLVKAYKNTYYRGIFEFQKRMGYLTEFNVLDGGKVDEVIRTPWSGSDFSSRIWTRTDRLTELIRQEITTAAIQGRSLPALAKRISGQMHVGYSAAERLVRTETAFVVGQGELRHYEEISVEKYEYMATLDSRTSDICQKLDGKTFPIEDAVAGLNYPPMHARCRSTTIPDFEDEESGGTRMARDAAGKSITVTADMKYKEWYNKYVESTKLPEKLKLPDAALSKQLSFALSGKRDFIPTNTAVTDIHVIAGAGVSVTLRAAKGLSEKIGGKPENWRKVVGKIESGKYIHDVHWYENPKDGFGQVDAKLKERREKR